MRNYSKRNWRIKKRKFLISLLLQKKERPLCLKSVEMWWRLEINLMSSQFMVKSLTPYQLMTCSNNLMEYLFKIKTTLIWQSSKISNLYPFWRVTYKLNKNKLKEVISLIKLLKYMVITCKMLHWSSSQKKIM